MSWCFYLRTLQVRWTGTYDVQRFCYSLVRKMREGRGFPMVRTAIRMRDFRMRWGEVARRIIAIPVVFLGVGIYRAWLSIFFRYGVFPAVGVFDYFVFEGAIGVASLALALLAARITPLWANNRMVALTLTAMTLGSALLVACNFLPSPLLKATGLVGAGAGLASLILMWAEFYGSLNPMRVAIYHALAIFTGECMKWLFMGMSAAYLMFFALVLPVVSVVNVRLSMRHLPDHEFPHATRVFPWKPILLMSACTFAGGFGSLPAQPLVVGNVAGAMLVTALVFLGVLSQARWFNFNTIYQLAFPLFIIGFLLVQPAGGRPGWLMALCYDAGYTMLSMFIMLVMSNITYRFGISAVWINGIERGIRYLAEIAGWGFGVLVVSHSTPLSAEAIFYAITAILIAIFIVVFVTERNLFSKWGITAEALGTDDENHAARVSMHVATLSRRHGLTPREEEVLQLLVRGKSMADMEHELFVAQGTIKAHINHIYRKFDVHSRKDLLALCLSEEPAPVGGASVEGTGPSAVPDRMPL